ncbi:hypothetical protein C0W92_02720 [Photobacterium angustum]|uniref:t-SNARE coiled-coil homology domain-containing protein n=2 Tax=Photobacterium angustum TaxID=661 RepID=A0A855SFN1_PHOAN|nr:hypothetical protein [Photobacterium angustum]EAS65546.1 hypothetical protein VAS14_09554 [Photobacterium angustum S14]KJF93893.1 hypothetical protein UB39_13050 [Photobacterium angustum]KJG31638.1 hypothetical protein UA69_08385 [Photobacterium angustum]KJG38526.1 hypothetical protein UA32_08775 [Photobacterium angustum]KJG42523.1 hypothetical protein UA35_00510 [Photobacterium angustum]
MYKRYLTLIPVVALLTLSTAHADSLIQGLNRVDNSIDKVQNTIHGTQNSIRNGQNKVDNTQRAISEIQDGTYVEKRVEKKVRNQKRKAVNGVINKSTNAIRKATNVY